MSNHPIKFFFVFLLSHRMGNYYDLHYLKESLLQTSSLVIFVADAFMLQFCPVFAFEWVNNTTIFSEIMGGNIMTKYWVCEILLVPSSMSF